MQFKDSQTDLHDSLFFPPELNDLLRSNVHRWPSSIISFQLWSDKWRELWKLFYRCSVYAISEKNRHRTSEKESSMAGTGRYEQQSLSEPKQPVTQSGGLTMLCPLIQMKPCRWKAQPGNPFAVCKHDVWFDSKIWPQQISGMWPNKTPSPNGRFIFGFVGLPTLMKAVPWSMQCRQREPGQGPQHCTLVSFIR